MYWREELILRVLCLMIYGWKEKKTNYEQFLKKTDLKMWESSQVHINMYGVNSGAFSYSLVKPYSDGAKVYAM